MIKKKKNVANLTSELLHILPYGLEAPLRNVIKQLTNCNKLITNWSELYGKVQTSCLNKSRNNSIVQWYQLPPKPLKGL